MKFKLPFLIISIAVGVFNLTSCNRPEEAKSESPVTFDTIDAVKINGLWVLPKESFIYNSCCASLHDTLCIVACGNFVYEPFGTLKSDTNLATSVLKNLPVLSKEVDTFRNADVCNYLLYTQKIKLQNNYDRLELFLDNDPEASRHSYINSGEIYSDKILLAENIKTGMTQEDFYKAFFDVFPAELQNRFNVVVFEPCVIDTRHFYTFKNKKLFSIKFIN